MIALMFKFKLKLCKTYLWKKILNSPPSFIEQKSPIKHFVQWECLALALFGKIREDNIFFFIWIRKEICPKSTRINSLWDSNWLLHLQRFPLSISNSWAVLSNPLVYSNHHLVFLPQNVMPFIKVLVSSLEFKINNLRKFMLQIIPRKICIQSGNVINCSRLCTIFLIYIVQWWNYGIRILKYPELHFFLKVFSLWVTQF